MKSITLIALMSWRPCPPYPRGRIKRLFAGRKRITWRGVAKWRIPAADRLWVLLRTELVDEAILFEFVCDVAERALMAERAAGREPHADSWNAIAVRRRWLRGEATDEDVRQAYVAANAAAYAADAAHAAHAARAAAYAAYAAAHAARAAAYATYAAEREGNAQDGGRVAAAGGGEAVTERR